MDELWHLFKQALTAYNTSTEERKVAFEALKVKDERSAKEIESQMRKLQRISVRFCFASYIFTGLDKQKMAAENCKYFLTNKF